MRPLGNLFSGLPNEGEAKVILFFDAQYTNNTASFALVVLVALLTSCKNEDKHRQDKHQTCVVDADCVCTDPGPDVCGEAGMEWRCLKRICSLETRRLYFWGAAQRGLQLSLTVVPNQPKDPFDVVLILGTRNSQSVAQQFDAGLPQFNESSLLVVDPLGRETRVSAWADALMRLEIPPGDKNWGEFRETRSTVTTQSYWFPAAATQTGTYRMKWQLKDIVSNEATVTF
jgi:hypothetical protein